MCCSHCQWYVYELNQPKVGVREKFKPWPPSHLCKVGRPQHEQGLNVRLSVLEKLQEWSDSALVRRKVTEQGWLCAEPFRSSTGACLTHDITLVWKWSNTAETGHSGTARDILLAFTKHTEALISHSFMLTFHLELDSMAGDQNTRLSAKEMTQQNWHDQWLSPLLPRLMWSAVQIPHFQI